MSHEMDTPTPSLKQRFLATTWGALIVLLLLVLSASLLGWMAGTLLDLVQAKLGR